jgi:hypothetical protein
MTDPLSPSEARADDLKQRARQFIAAQKALLGDLAPCVTSDLLAALVQAEQREADKPTVARVAWRAAHARRGHEVETGSAYDECRTCGATYWHVSTTLKESPENFNVSETVKADVCQGCGGVYRFDTSVPSVLWNRVIRAQGLPEYLCTACILRAFAKAGVSFTAELCGDEFDRLPIEFTINGAESTAVLEVQDENNDLRCSLRDVEAKLVQAEQEKAAANHGRKAAEDNQVRWMRLHSEAESRLSALTATVRQVEQEMQPYTNASNIKRWADTLRDALKEQG